MGRAADQCLVQVVKLMRVVIERRGGLDPSWFRGKLCARKSSSVEAGRIATDPAAQMIP